MTVQARVYRAPPLAGLQAKRALVLGGVVIVLGAARGQR